ncbi:MAG: cupin [Actinomycetota bacterium]|nr:cupin [Actinomycetota bacterium]
MGSRKARWSVLATAVTAVTLAAGVALATPGSGITPTVHVARATLTEKANVNADRIRFKTKKPTDVSVVTLRMAPGATTGWHRHPGVVIIAVTQGTGTLYSSDCSSRAYSAGQVFVESGDDAAGVFRNETASDVVITVTFVAPKGAAFRIDAPNPGCPVS